MNLWGEQDNSRQKLVEVVLMGKSDKSLAFMGVIARSLQDFASIILLKLKLNVFNII
jgi:hypothetical protein